MAKTAPALTGLVAAVAAVVGVWVTVHINSQTQEAQRATQQQTDFTTASQQLAAADAFSQAAGITTLATLVKNDPTTYRAPVCQIVPSYITQAAAADLAHAPKATRRAPARQFAYRPGVLLAIQNISPNCENWAGLQLTRWALENTDLRGVNLFFSNLSGADLSSTFLSRANLSEANLTGTFLSGAHLSGAHLHGAHLSGADLHGADLHGADLTFADLSHADLHGADLSGAHLSVTNVLYANLSGANLSGAHLHGETMLAANLSKAVLSGADLSGARLAEVNLAGADLTGANFTDVSLTMSKYDKNTKWPQGFVPPPSR